MRPFSLRITDSIARVIGWIAAIAVLVVLPLSIVWFKPWAVLLFWGLVLSALGLIFAPLFSVSPVESAKLAPEWAPRVIMPNRFRFYLRKPHWFDDILEKLRLERRFRTGDRSFDDWIYVRSDDSVLLSALSTDIMLRREILQVLQVLYAQQLTFMGIRCWGGVLSAEVPDLGNVVRGIQPVMSQEYIARVREVSQALLPLAHRLTAINTGEWSSSREPTARYVPLFRVIVSAIAIPCFPAACSMASLEGEFMPHVITHGNSVLLATIVCAASLLLAALAATRVGRGGVYVRGMVGVALVVMVPAAFILSLAGAIRANIRSDDSVRQEYVVRVVDQYLTKRRGRNASTQCHLVMDRWPDVSMPSSLNVPRGYCVKPNTCFQIVYRQGRFGDPWLESMRVAPSCRSALERIDSSASHRVRWEPPRSAPAG